MVCKVNEAVALNTKTTLAIIKKHDIVAIKADKTHDDAMGEAVNQLLIDLGHTSTSIPFLVVFPGNGDPPIAFSGPVTQRMVSDALEKSVVASARVGNRPATAGVAAN